MIRYLLKNNVKLMLRNKWILVTMALGPILVTMLLASAFHDMMQSYERAEQFSVGYSIDEKSEFAAYIEEIEKAGEEKGMSFLKFSEGEIESLIQKNELAGFVVFEEGSYTIYETEDTKIEGITLEYFLHRVLQESKAQVLQNIMPVAPKEVKLPVQKIDYMPEVEAKDYYGIAEIVYFLWLGLLFAAPVFASEQKNGIGKKFQVSSLSSLQLYLGQWIPIVTATTLGIGLAVAVTTIMYDIAWGNLWIAGIVLFLAILASSSFGLMLYYLFQNLAVTVIVLFSTVMYMGFVGGSFETYLFSSYPESVKSTSLIYHLNRTLVEYCAMGRSDYLKSCILYAVCMTICCFGITFLIQRIRKGGKA